jgi:hypothetical protein
MANGPFGVPIRHSLTIRLLSACAAFLNEKKAIMTYFDFLESKITGCLTRDNMADWRSPQHVRKPHGREAAEKPSFSADRTGHEFRLSRETCLPRAGNWFDLAGNKIRPGREKIPPTRGLDLRGYGDFAFISSATHCSLTRRKSALSAMSVPTAIHNPIGPAPRRIRKPHGND